MNAKLKDILERAEAWPQAAQEQLVQIAEGIEVELGGSYHATPEELEAIDEGLRDLAAGRVSTQEDFAAIFAKSRK